MHEQHDDDDKKGELERNRDDDFCAINVPDSVAGTCQKPTTLAIVDEIHQKSNLECRSQSLETQLPNTVQNNNEDNKNNNNIMNIQRLFTPVKISIVNNGGSNINDDSAKIYQNVENQKVTTSPLPLSPTAITGYANRSASAGSAKSAGGLSIGSISGDICRICHCESAPDAPLIAPCYCSGTLKYVHQKCLQQWIKSSQTRSCEVCRFSFIMQSKLKPFRKWEKLDMGTAERRKILCNVTFHIVALICIVWSLYVLVERTADEIRESTLEWPFWTKLVVMAIGFTGCIVLVYVQWKTYVRLFMRWRAYNRVIFVQNGPSIHKGEAGAGCIGASTTAAVGSGRRSSAAEKPTPKTTSDRAALTTATTTVVEIR